MNYQKATDMNYQQFFAVEEQDHPTRLSCWRNVNNLLAIELCPNDDPDNPYQNQLICLDLADAQALIKELTSIVTTMRQQQTGRPEGLKVEKETQLKLMTL